MGEGSACGSGASWTGNEISYAFEGRLEKGAEIMGCVDGVSSRGGWNLKLGFHAFAFDIDLA